MGNAPGRDRRRSDDVGAAAAGGGDLDVGHVPPLLLAKHSTADSAYSFQQRPRRVSAAAAAAGGGGAVMTAAAVGSVLEEEPLTLPPTRRRDSGGAPEPRSPRQPHPPLKQQHSAPAETFSSTEGVDGVDQGEVGAIGRRLLPLVVEYVAARDAQEVRLCASFTDWKPQPMAVSERDAAGDVYMSIFNLPMGRHEYRFLVDGIWRVDRRAAQCPDARLIGVTNNYRLVGSDDLAACDAMTQLTGGGQGGSVTPPGSYCQTVPPYRPWSAQSMQPPPALPPHLLQVILNKDTPLSCEPTLLPAPNHVMLNHLYALSIKEGVMVLSATHRYRKKYVTTLLYKPV